MTDPSGRVHAITGRDLRYLSVSEGVSGAIEEVSSVFTSTSRNAVAVDAFGAVHVAFGDSVDDEVYYARRSPSGG